MGPLERVALLKRSETILFDERPVLPVYFAAGNELLKPYVKGAYAAPWDVSRMNEVWIDRQWQQRQERPEEPRD